MLLVVGASGSGKSTLARAIAGLIPGDLPGIWTGGLEIDGLELPATSRAAVAERVGIVFQDPASQIVMERVDDDVAFGLENRAWPLDAMRARVPEVLDQVGLGGLRRRQSAQLSGGQQQRLAVAGVLAPRPGILVLDEPTANLDPSGTAAVFTLLARLRADRGATIVLIEHRVDAAWPLADKVLALGRDGTPIDIGAPDEVLARSGSLLRAEGIWLPVAAEARLSPPQASEPAAGGRLDRSRTPGWTRHASISEGPVVRPEDIWPVVVAAGLSFGYEPGTLVVRDVDLAVARGERVALVGANGSGKTTLGRLLVGLLRPTHGEVQLGGRDPARLPARLLTREAGYIFQDPDLGFVAERVVDEVRAGLPSDRWPDADAMLERLGLPLAAFANRSPYRLSGGEARRLSLAAALVRQPSLLVLDEPTYGQDRRGYESLLEILADRVAAGTAVVAATHDERFVRDFATRRVEMADGWIVADDGAPAPGAATLAEAPQPSLVMEVREPGGTG